MSDEQASPTVAPDAQPPAPAVTMADVQRQIADAVRADRQSSERQARNREVTAARLQGHRPIEERHRRLDFGNAGFWSNVPATTGCPEVEMLKLMHGRAVDGYAALLDTIAANGRNAMLAVPDRVAANARQAKQLRDQTVNAINSALDKAHDEISAAGKRIHRASIPADGYDRQMSGEVRGHMRSLPERDRIGYLNKAIENNDVLLMQAIASAPAALSSVHRDLHKRVRDELAALLSPEDTAALAALQRGVELVTGTRDSLLSHLSELFDPTHLAKS